MGERYTDRVVLITGGGAGIGRRYASRFAAEGADIVVADLDPTAAATVVAEVDEAGRSGLAVTMDVTDDTAVEKAVAATVERFGGIDVLVNNAGVHLEHAQLPFTLEALPDWRRVLDVNVIGAYICAVACREAMAGRDGAAIVNHSSMAAWSGGNAYAVSKLALNALTVGLAEELAADGIRVNGIAPSLVDSEAAVEWMHSPARAGVEDLLVGRQMIQRLGRMDDLADAALFLCSADASFITGQTLLVDGGFTRKAF